MIYPRNAKPVQHPKINSCYYMLIEMLIETMSIENSKESSKTNKKHIRIRKVSNFSGYKSTLKSTGFLYSNNKQTNRNFF